MNATVLASLITGLLSLAGVMLSNLLSDRRRENALRTAQAVTDEQLRQLTREVREHNNFARRMPVVEEQIKVINHRLEDLEKDQLVGTSEKCEFLAGGNPRRPAGSPEHRRSVWLCPARTGSGGKAAGPDQCSVWTADHSRHRQRPHHPRPVRQHSGNGISESQLIRHGAAAFAAAPDFLIHSLLPGTGQATGNSGCSEPGCSS